MYIDKFIVYVINVMVCTIILSMYNMYILVLAELGFLTDVTCINAAWEIFVVFNFHRMMVDLYLP